MDQSKMPRLTRAARRLAPLGLLLPAVLGLAACKPEEVQSAKPATPVRVGKAELAEYSPAIRLTGEIQARIQSDLSFRVGGRVIERLVNVGDRVSAGQILARLDPRQQQASLTAAEATVAAAEATLQQRSTNYERQKALLVQGYTTRRDHDMAEEAYRTALATLDAARAQLASARDQLSDTVLCAAGAGIVTARNVETGQVVQAARSVYSIAQDGPRDAVFNVYETSMSNGEPSDLAVHLTLVSNPGVTATGVVREVSPTVDTANGTVKVKIGIEKSASEMALGAAVIGEVRFASRQFVSVPASALFSANGGPAVWTVDHQRKVVSLRLVAVESYDSARVLLRAGLRPDESIVTAGTQLLSPNQTVALAEGAAR